MAGVRSDGGKGDDVLKTVTRIGGKLASEGGGGEAAVVESSLRELQGVRMTFEALEATKIGRAVNALRKNAPSQQARQLAAALYTGWKALADERFRSSRTQQQEPKADEGIKKRSSPSSSSPPPAVDVKQSGKAEQRRVTIVVRRTAAALDLAPSSNTTRQEGGGPYSNNRQVYCPATASHLQGTSAAVKRVLPTGAAPLTTAKPPTAPLPTKLIGSSSGGCKRKAEASTVFDEARLAKARARLHEGYKQVSAAKEKRKTKEISVIAAVKLEKKARKRPVRHVRCTAARRTGKKQAPVPCPPRMPRAF